MSCDIINDAGADGVTLPPWILADIFAAIFGKLFVLYLFHGT